jgi:hypothetical protein
MFKRSFALVMVALSAFSPGLVKAQVLEWTAHTRGRMIDVYDPGESPEHLLATGLTMATLAIAAYDDDPVGRGLDVRGAHYEEVHFESEPTTDAQALVVRDNRALVVAFRGSESRLDWAGDLATVTDVGRDRGAHLGFATATRSVASRLTTVLRNELSRGTREVWITGHCLGGAMLSSATQIRSNGTRSGRPREGCVGSRRGRKAKRALFAAEPSARSAGRCTLTR